MEIPFLPLTEGDVRCTADGGACYRSALELDLEGEYWLLIGMSDLDHDSYVDIVLGSTIHERLRVLRGGGECGFASSLEVDLGQDLDDLALADVTGEGRVDLLVDYNSVPSQLRHYRMGENGTLELYNSLEMKAGSHAWITPADIDSDGVAEVLYAYGDRIDIVSTRNQPWSVVGSVQLKGETSGVGVGDFTGDGNLDIVTNHVYGFDEPVFESFVLQGDGKGGFTLAFTFESTLNLYSYEVATGDFDGNSTTDFVMAGDVWYTNGKGGLLTRRTLLGTHDPTSGRFNDDEATDLVSEGRIYLGGGEDLVLGLVLIESERSLYQGVGDLNKDGLDDIGVLEDTDTSVLHIFLSAT